MLDFDKALELAKLGWKAEDIKTLMSMEDTKSDTEPTQADTEHTEQTQADTQNTEPTQADTEKDNLIKQLQEQVAELQQANVNRDMSKNKDTKTSEEILADFARSFM